MNDCCATWAYALAPSPPSAFALDAVPALVALVALLAVFAELAWLTDRPGARLVICLLAAFLAILLTLPLLSEAMANEPPPTATISAIAEITIAGEGSRRTLCSMKPSFGRGAQPPSLPGEDRKSTRLNSSHPSISYAVFCL